MKKLFFIISGLLTVCILSAQDVKLDEIVAKYLKAIGQDKIASIKTIVITGKSSAGGMEVPMIQTEKRPDSRREDVDLQGTKIVFAYDGKSGWMILPMTGSPDPQDMPAELLNSGIKDNMRDPYTNWNNPFVNWKENGIKMELSGKEDMNGTQVYNIMLTFKDNDITNYYLDANKYLVLKIKYKENAQGQIVDKEDIYNDFRLVDGIINPFRIESMTNGQPQDIEIVEKCEFNLPVNDSIFVKPVVKK